MELNIRLSREHFNLVKQNKITKYPLSKEQTARFRRGEDFDRIKFSYKTRNLFREYEGIDPDGTLHVGDRCVFSRNSNQSSEKYSNS